MNNWNRKQYKILHSKYSTTVKQIYFYNEHENKNISLTQNVNNTDNCIK